jgi:hypothetical protein
VSEQEIEVEDPETGRRRRMRLLTLELDTPTEDGETTIRLLTNLRRVDARRVCELYRERWRIEISHPNYPSSDNLYLGSRAA